MPVLALSSIVDLTLSRPPQAGDCRVVAIDGPSGSGKTSLAARLADLLGATTLHMDHVYPGWDGLAAAPGLLVEGVLGPIAVGRTGSHRRWSWVRDEWRGRQEVEPSPVLVVEGVGAGARVCAAYANVLLWVEAPHQVRYRRAMERDGDTFAPHWEQWGKQEEQMFAAERTRDRADLRIDGDPKAACDRATEFVTVDVPDGVGGTR